MGEIEVEVEAPEVEIEVEAPDVEVEAGGSSSSSGGCNPIVFLILAILFGLGAVGSLVYMIIGIHSTSIVISMVISAAVNAGLAVLCFCCYCKKNSSSDAEVALVAEVG